MLIVELCCRVLPFSCSLPSSLLQSVLTLWPLVMAYRRLRKGFGKVTSARVAADGRPLVPMAVDEDIVDQSMITGFADLHGKRKAISRYVPERRLAPPLQPDSILDHMDANTDVFQPGDCELDNLGLVQTFEDEDLCFMLPSDHDILSGSAAPLGVPGQSDIPKQGQQEDNVKDGKSTSKGKKRQVRCSSAQSLIICVDFMQTDHMDAFRKVADLYALEALRKEHILSYADGVCCSQCGLQDLPLPPYPSSSHSPSFSEDLGRASRSGAQVTFKCNDCFGNHVWCRACLVKGHQTNPFHRIEVCG